MRRDARTRKQNGKPELPIQRIPQRGESRGLIGFVVHRFVTGPKLELVENMTDLYPGAEFGLAARRFRQCLRVCRDVLANRSNSIRSGSD